VRSLFSVGCLKKLFNLKIVSLSLSLFYSIIEIVPPLSTLFCKAENDMQTTNPIEGQIKNTRGSRKCS
jgi:hypothetical protein